MIFHQSPYKTTILILYRLTSLFNSITESLYHIREIRSLATLYTTLYYKDFACIFKYR